MQAVWLQVVIPSVTALVSSVVGALVGGHIVRGVAREQMRENPMSEERNDCKTRHTSSFSNMKPWRQKLPHGRTMFVGGVRTEIGTGNLNENM